MKKPKGPTAQTIEIRLGVFERLNATLIKPSGGNTDMASFSHSLERANGGEAVDNQFCRTSHKNR